MKTRRARKAKRISAVACSILASLCVLAVGCASNPNKAKDIDTKMDKSANISGDEDVGVKDGNLVVQKKVQMNEELRRLQNEVYSLEDRVYGNRKYGSKGLYGTLKDCRLRLTSKELGGDGKLMWTEPIDRVTDKEEDFEIGIDEKEKIVGISEEFLLDRLKRFKNYKRVLQKRQDEYEEKIDVCDAAVRGKEYEQKKKAEAEKAATTGS